MTDPTQATPATKVDRLARFFAERGKETALSLAEKKARILAYPSAKETFEWMRKHYPNQPEDEAVEMFWASCHKQ